jgi:hypothetical protein
MDAIDTPDIRQLLHRALTGRGKRQQMTLDRPRQHFLKQYEGTFPNGTS